MAPSPTQVAFTEFLKSHGPGLRHAFIARYGPDVGTDVMGDVSEYAWKHWEKVSQMDNPSGWLYRVGQSRSRPYFRRPVRFPSPRPEGNTIIEPTLPGLVESLPERQRVAVLLTQAFGYTVREAAEIIGVTPSTVQQNTQRGLTRLRARMGVPSDA
jgi:DNA-directed RNA polymerase specialized sigma24 family protein